VTQQDAPGESASPNTNDSTSLMRSPPTDDQVIDVEYEVLREAVRPAHGPAMFRAIPKARSIAAEGAGPEATGRKPVESVEGGGSLKGEAARDAVSGWGDAHGQSPEPRHRRRLILKWVKPLDFADCLDAGCGDGRLLHDIVRQGGSLGRTIAGFGCDASLDDALTRQRDPLGCSLLKFDPLVQAWPDRRQFDLVVCSEVLGRTPHWRPALANLIKMTRKYLLLTVPSGPVRMADRVARHQHHFDDLELAGAVVGHGLTLLKQRRWGFPIHSLYQSTLGHLPTGLGTGRPAGEPVSSLSMRLVAEGLYLAFFSNDLFHGGAQQILLAQRKDGIGR